MAATLARSLMRRLADNLRRPFSVQTAIKRDLMSFREMFRKYEIPVDAHEFVSTVKAETVIEQCKDPDAVASLKRTKASHFLIGSEVNTKVIYGCVESIGDKKMKEIVNYEPASVRRD